jgi:hypothetical protein
VFYSFMRVRVTLGLLRGTQLWAVSGGFFLVFFCPKRLLGLGVLFLSEG